MEFLAGLVVGIFITSLCSLWFFEGFTNKIEKILQEEKERLT